MNPYSAFTGYGEFTPITVRSDTVLGVKSPFARPERWVEAYRMHKAGATMRQIGERLGFSPQRAKSMVAKAERMVRLGKESPYADYFAEWVD